MAKDCIGSDVDALVNGLEDGQCCLLENVRFYKGACLFLNFFSLAQGLPERRVTMTVYLWIHRGGEE